MTIAEERHMAIVQSSLRKIAEELERSNKLKALEMHAAHDEGLSDAAFREGLNKIMDM